MVSVRSQQTDAAVVAEAHASGCAPWVVSASASTANGFEIVGRRPASPSVSTLGGRSVVMFDGVLYNRQELAAQLAAVDELLTASDLVLLAYQRWALDLPRHLKGIFAIVVVDPLNRQVVAVRDSLGAYPVFYTETNGRLLISTSIDALREQPGVRRSVNREALADHLCHRWTDPHETFFEAIRRVPSGHVLTSSDAGVLVSRYWNPVPDDRPVDWVAEEDLQREFEARFGRAVDHALGHGRAGIFLSGGLDSISVAAMATDVSRRTGRPVPLALSLGFPGDADEEMEQRGVARSLGLNQEFVPFDQAVPTSQLLTSALAITRKQPAPLLNTWMPAYTDLALRAKRRGVRSILSGAGGDEWLGVSPFLAADLMRALDFSGLRRLVAGWRRSYNVPLPRLLRTILWQFGIGPLASSVLERVAPRAWTANRLRRSVRGIAGWVAPDPRLRASLAERIERSLPPANPPKGFYFRDVRLTVEHPLASMELEEIFEMGRRLELRFLHPYWDADVADILYRTPPLLLLAGGRAKSVVRATMARRFPRLGLDRQKKRGGTNFFRSVLERDVPLLWRRHGDLSALSDLGIVEPRAAGAMAADSLASGAAPRLLRNWDLMNAETWLRAHQ